VPNLLQPPSLQHLVGTDRLGRDVFSRLLYGLRLDLFLGAAVLTVPFIVGCLIGGVSTFRGGWIDAVTQRVCDVIVAFPFYVLVIALAFSLGPGTSSLFVAISLVSWVPYARIVRAQVLVDRELGYVDAARTAGYSTTRIVTRHLAPNVLSQPMIFLTSDIVATMLAIVTLGFLGLGVQAPTADLGGMIRDGQEFLATNWWLSITPGLLIVYTGCALALIGDGLADRLDRR
jgi:peptide/nickel transport system permease protein